MKPTLHLLMGLPGSGKTTLAKTLQELTKAARLSSDEHRLNIYPEPTFSQTEHDNLYGLLDHSVEHLLQAGQDVIYDANLNRHVHRQEKYDLAKKHDARVLLWWVKAPAGLARKRRILEQNPTLIPSGETSERMFDRIAEVIEVPSKDEPSIEVDGTDITTTSIKSLLRTSESELNDTLQHN